MAEKTIYSKELEHSSCKIQTSRNMNLLRKEEEKKKDLSIHSYTQWLKNDELSPSITRLLFSASPVDVSGPVLT